MSRQQQTHVTPFSRLEAFPLGRIHGALFPRGTCPECGKHDASIAFTPDGKGYTCSLCGRAGDLQHFVGVSRRYLAARLSPSVTQPEYFMDAVATGLETGQPISGALGAQLGELARK